MIKDDTAGRALDQRSEKRGQTPDLHATVERGRVRLLYLDGIRGLAALYVTLYHAQQFAPSAVVRSGIPRLLAKVFNYGHYAVAVFIVLSGYVLMLPVARAIGGRLPGGWWKYLGRRARRILPAYYAALALSLLLIALFPPPPGGGTPQAWPGALPALAWKPVLTHVLMVHNFSENGLINPPMWSVPVEFDIYLLFPLILLPIWRRGGTASMVAVGIIAGLAPHWLASGRLDFYAPWYLGAFVLGAAAADLNFGNRDQVPWGVVLSVSTAICAFFIIYPPIWAEQPTCVEDTLVAIAIAALLGNLGHAACDRRVPGWVVRLLESRTMLWLGTISYSLYLIHYPILSLLRRTLAFYGAERATMLYGMLGLGAMVSLAAAYPFHLCFERPWMRGRSKAAISAALDPAP